MDSFVLKLAIRWLPAADALAATCVSSEWHAELSSEQDNGDLWKQVCRNTNTLVVDAILKQQNGCEMDFRRLALSFGRSLPVTPRRLSPPTMSPNKLFAVVDLYRRADTGKGKRRRVIEASWVCSVGFSETGTNNICMPPHEGGQKMLLQAANPYSAEHVNTPAVQEWEAAVNRHSQKSPLHFAAYDLVGMNAQGQNIPSKSLRTKVTLFRRDTMQSVCIMDEDNMDCATGGDQDPAEEVVRFHYHSKDSLRFADNKAGYNAKLLSEQRIFSRLGLNGEFCLKATLPDPDSEEEPLWLANSRHAVRTMNSENQVYNPDAKDQAALKGIPSFDYEVLRFNFTFRVSTDMPFDFWDEFDSQDDMMIALEGLCWQ